MSPSSNKVFMARLNAPVLTPQVEVGDEFIGRKGRGYKRTQYRLRLGPGASL